MESRLQAEATVVSDVRRPRVKLNATPPGNVLAHVTAAELAKPPASGVFCAHLPPTRRPALGRKRGVGTLFQSYGSVLWDALGGCWEVRPSCSAFSTTTSTVPPRHRNSAVSSSDAPLPNVVFQVPDIFLRPRLAIVDIVIRAVAKSVHGLSIIGQLPLRTGL